MTSINSDYILKGVLQTFNQKSNGRIYDGEMYSNVFKNYQNELILKQREENIDSLLEDRESKNVSTIPVSYEQDHVGNIKNMEIVDDKLIVDMEIKPETKIDYLNIDINVSPMSISSRGFTNSNDIS